MALREFQDLEDPIRETAYNKTLLDAYFKWADPIEVDLVEYLLLKGCTFSDKDQALVEAATKRSDLECFKLLVERVGCDVNSRRHNHWHFDSPMACYVNSMSARDKDPQVVKYLLERGFDYRTPQIHFLH